MTPGLPSPIPTDPVIDAARHAADWGVFAFVVAVLLVAVFGWLWVENVADLPAEVREVVSRHLGEGCGVELPLGASPYHLDEGWEVWLCRACADPSEV